MQLYFFGILFGLFSLLREGVKTSLGVYHGFNSAACAAVASLAICGLLVSFILKYLNNIAKCFINAFSLILVAVFQAAGNRTWISLNVLLGIALTSLAVEQYMLSA